MIFLNYLINYIYIYFILFACILLPLHEAFKFPHISISSMRNNFELFDIAQNNRQNNIGILSNVVNSLLLAAGQAAFASRGNQGYEAILRDQSRLERAGVDPELRKGLINVQSDDFWLPPYMVLG